MTVITNKNIVSLAKEIYRETLNFNNDCQAKIPEMKIFNWQPWNYLDRGIKFEYYTWTKYLMKTCNFKYTVDQRHAFAVANRLNHGWKLDDERNDNRKTDPYLIPMSSCPDWMREWCEGKDKIMISYVREVLKNE